MYTTPSIECPYCFNRAGFTVTAIDGYKDSREVTIAGKKQQFVTANTLTVCPNCKNSCLVIIETTPTHYNQIKEAITSFQYIPTFSYISVIKCYPEPAPPYTHKSLPEKVNKLFIDLQDIERQKKAPPIIIGACRSVLEASVKELGAEGKTLREKIDNLLTQGIITRHLAEWAHYIRIEGNEAIHEITATPEEATELIEFTKIFLIFTFELPARIKEKRTTHP